MNSAAIHDQRKIISTNPAKNYEVIGEVDISSVDEIKNAVSSAKAAFPQWRDLGVAKRVSYLAKLRDYIEKNKEGLNKITSQEMGKPITQARSSFDWSMWHFNWYLENAEKYLSPTVNFETKEEIHTQYLEPYGVAGVIVPWNFPLSNFVMSVVQTLLAGNTIVYKTSEEVPLFGKLIDKAFAACGFPKGIFTQVYGYGEVGQALSESEIDFLHFTGSSAVGHKLYQQCAKSFIPCVLELGGSDAGIVFDDADYVNQLESIFWAKFVNNGQICCGLKRMLVQENILEDFVSKFTKLISGKKIGNPEEEDTAFGSLAAERQLKLLAEQVDDARSKGAKVIECSKVPSSLKGAFYPPTLILGLKPDMRAWKEELFGPVLPIFSFKEETEAVQLANDTQYGLSGYVYTKDTERAQRIASQIETGSVSINSCDFSGPYNPFGGYKRSGMAKTGGQLGFINTCRAKVVSLRK